MGGCGTFLTRFNCSFPLDIILAFEQEYHTKNDRFALAKLPQDLDQCGAEVGP
jgi:hypothetical protein